jgi:hypothetical protein
MGIENSALFSGARSEEYCFREVYCLALEESLDYDWSLHFLDGRRHIVK